MFTGASRGIPDDGMRGAVSADDTPTPTVTTTTTPTPALTNITSLSITGLTEPVLGAPPDTSISVLGGGTPVSVSWTPAVSPFAENTQYKATITIQNASGYVFNTTEPLVSLNGDALSSSDVTLNTATQLLTISHTFPATEAKVLPTITLSTNITNNIGTVPLPVKFTYTVTNATSISWTSWTYGDGSSPSLSSLSGTLDHTYATAGTYTANLTATNANGTVYKPVVITVKKSRTCCRIPGFRSLSDRPPDREVHRHLGRDDHFKNMEFC